MELDDIAERMEMGWRGRLRDGKLGPGEVLYGYKRAKNEAGEKTGYAEVDEDEAATVRRIFDLYLAGTPWLEVRRVLEAEGKHPRSGGKWHITHLKRIVNQETYTTSASKPTSAPPCSSARPSG